MKKAAIQLFFAVLGIFLGALWANRAINSVEKNDSLVLRNGTWRYFASMDLAESDLQRAFIGRIGLFALNDSEAIYFIANEDDDGQPLRSTDQYIIEGSSYDADYWSLALYGEDHFLLQNNDKRYAYNQTSISYKDSLRSSYTIHLGGKSVHQENYLPTTGDQNITLLLRLYQPSKELYSNKGKINLPRIKKID